MTMTNLLFKVYLDVILKGARENGIPQSYIEQLQVIFYNILLLGV